MTQDTGVCPQTPQRTGELYEAVRFQNQPALFTSLRVKTAGIAEGLHRYEVRHEDGEPCQIARTILVDHYGTLLTSDPVQLPADGYLTISPEDLVFSSGTRVTPEDFLRRNPPTGRDVMELFAAKSEEAPLLFSWGDGRDETYGCIGHMRGYFERNILHHTWWPHYWDDQCNNAAFKADITRVVDWLKVGFAPLKNLEIMDAFCARRPQAAIPKEDRAYGFRIETSRYRYMLRCTPVRGTYQVYLYCYCKAVMPQ